MTRYNSENREIMAGRVLPKSAGHGRNFIICLKQYERRVARSSEQLLISMLKYGARNRGLPNISREECRARLMEDV